VTWLQDGHSYAISPGSFPTGAILTTSSIGALQRGQATLLCGSSDTTRRIQAMFTLGQTRRSFFGCVTWDLYGRKLSAKKIPARGRGRPARGHQRVAPMPIRRYLDDHRFDLETVRLMGIAFEMALASLRATPDHADPVREMIARKIIGLAQAGERDPERLCDGALKDLPQASKPPDALTT
jgi:hypothetical protein